MTSIQYRGQECMQLNILSLYTMAFTPTAKHQLCEQPLLGNSSVDMLFPRKQEHAIM
jgi:hypothetical protein